MRISMLTALEIFTNPNDLEIVIGTDGGKYGFAITRGPGHHYKVILDTSGFAETRAATVEVIKITLDSIRETLTRDLSDQGSVPSQYLNPDGQEIDQSKVLNPDLIGRILDELRQHQTASTYRMCVKTGQS